MGQSMTYEQYIAKRKALLQKQAQAYQKMVWNSGAGAVQVAEREIAEIDRQLATLDKVYNEQLVG